MNERIFVVLVTYNPDIKILRKCINSLKEQVEKIIIVDNTQTNEDHLSFDLKDHKYIEINYLRNNYGIAFAQNIGIKKALEEGADFILTSDQDTIYPENYIEVLLTCYIEESKNYKIACVSPIFNDKNKDGHLQPMVYFKNGLLYKDYKFKKIKSVSHVISSGMLIPVSVLNEIGLMNEKLFIDWVDTEWCWRAISKKYTILQTSNIKIYHCLGNYSKNILGKNITIHSPLRNYYKIRNAVYLFLFGKHLNVEMKLFVLQQIFKMVILHPLFSKTKYIELKMILRGILDGIFRRMGENKYLN